MCCTVTFFSFESFILTIAGMYMWETVSEKFNNRKDERAPWRDIDSIRNKFKSLKNATKPTGDPTCPPNVIRAKRLAKEIEDGKCVFQSGSSENSDGDDSMSNDISSSDCSDSPVLPRHALNSSPPLCHHRRDCCGSQSVHCSRIACAY